MNKCEEILLGLIRAAVERPQDINALGAEEWKALVDMAFEQGVEAISADGYVKTSPPALSVREGAKAEGCLLETEELEDLKYEWLGSVMQVEEDYRRHSLAFGELAKFYAEHGIRMMVLKGYGLSLNWPVPEHRITGDVDVFLMNAWKRADELIAERGIKIDYSHEHHSVFQWMGQSVENHYDIVNRYADRDGGKVDDFLKEIVGKGVREVEIGGVKIYLPSPTFNGVFLLRHSAAHFCGTHLTLRHLLDWAFMVDRDWKEIDWPLVVEWGRKMGQLRFLSCLNALCIDHLGICADKFPVLERDKTLEMRVMEDILHPAFTEKGSGFFYKLRRLRANRWKRDLVASEAYLPRMIRLAWSHLRIKIFKVKA